MALAAVALLDFVRTDPLKKNFASVRFFFCWRLRKRRYICTVETVRQLKLKAMTTEQRDTIRKVQAVLVSIENGTPKFFNVAQYKKLGLVETRTRWATNAVGNKVDMGCTFHLTPKAKRYLTVIV